MAELRGGATVGGYTVLHSGLANPYLGGNLLAASLSSSSYVGANVTATNSMPHFWFKNTAPYGYAPGNNNGIFLDNNLSIGLNAGAGGVYTMKNGTKTNVLDDGSGNMTISGHIIETDANEHQIRKTNANANHGYYMNDGAAGIYDWKNSRNILTYTLSSNNLQFMNTGGSTTTTKNTLDDGNGNMTIAGTILSNAGLININVSGDTKYQIKGKDSMGSYPGWDANMLYINIYSNGGTPTPTWSSGVTIRGKLYSEKNTLDDGSGNMTVNGTGTSTITGTLYLPAANSKPTATIGTTATVTSGSINGVLAFPGNGVQHAQQTWVPGTGMYFLDSSSYNPSTGVAPTSVARVPVYVGKLYSVNNTLDDGNGNTTIGGTLTVNGANILVKNGGWISGKDTSGNQHGMLEIDTSNRVVLNQDSSMGGIWTGYNGGVKNELDDGSGNMNVAGSLSVAGNITSNNNANFHIAPKASGSIGFTNNAQNAYGLYTTDSGSPPAYTFRNTLDDGNGNMYLMGGLYVKPLGTSTSSTNYGSNPLALQNNIWTNGTPTVNSRNIWMDTNGNIQVGNYAANANTFTLDNSGNGTFAGTITMNGLSLSITPSGTSNAGIELGSISGTSTPFIDFHSSGSANDYDARIIASGGTSGTVGAGTLAFYASQVTFANSGSIYLDGYGNVKAPSNAGSGSSWGVFDKNNALILKVLTDGAKIVGVDRTIKSNSNGIISIVPGPSGGGGTSTVNFDMWRTADGNGVIASNFAGLKWYQSGGGGLMVCDGATGADTTYYPISASAFNVNSDASVKESIMAHEDTAIEIIKNVPVYTYTLKHHKKHVGKYADKVGMLLHEVPEHLHGGEDTLDLYSLTSTLWKAVQELSQQVEELSAKLDK